MGPDAQSSSRHARYDQRIREALETLPAQECHCLCLVWCSVPQPLIAQLVGVHEVEVADLLGRAVSQIVSAVSVFGERLRTPQETDLSVNRSS
jgi:hypothetical protein